MRIQNNSRYLFISLWLSNKTNNFTVYKLKNNLYLFIDHNLKFYKSIDQLIIRMIKISILG